MITAPKMIIFDYGQTLVDEGKFDGVKGTAAVMQYASVNKYNLTPEQVQAEANNINKEFGRFVPATSHLTAIEVRNEQFQAYLYESLGIELSISYRKASRIFWDAAAPGKAVNGIGELLEYLNDQGIRTGVISNISFHGDVVADRINRLIPKNHFEFIIASSEYVFRKPNSRIFRLALTKAQLDPQDVWYVGDNFECDIIGAREAGLYPVWFTGCCNGKKHDELDIKAESMNVLKITDCKQLKALLVGLMSGEK